MTSLHKLRCAITAGDTQQIQSLLDATPTLVNEKDGNGWTVLHMAAISGLDSERVADLLLKSNPMLINAVDNYGKTPLHWAAQTDQEKVAEMLLMRNPKLIDTIANDGCTVLHYAREKVAEMLLTRSPKLIDAVNNNGWNALHCAAQHGNEKVAKILLSRMDPEAIGAVTHTGYTALHWAAHNGREKVAEMLLTRSPKLIDAVDNYGNTALHCAAAKGREKSATVKILLPQMSLEVISVVANNSQTAPHLKIIMEEHLKVRQQAAEALPKLVEAIKAGNMQQVQSLLDKTPALVNEKDDNGYTALHWAAWEGQEKVVDLLLMKAPKLIDAVDKGGYTALHLAAWQGQEKVVELLKASKQAAEGLPVNSVIIHQHKSVITIETKVEKLEYGLDQVNQITEVLGKKVDLNHSISERQKKKMKAEIVELEQTLKDIKGKVAASDPTLKKIITEINDLIGIKDITYELVDDINERLDKLKSQKPLGKSGTEACYYVKEIIYDNELLNHPEMFSKLANIYGANKVLDLSSQMSSELLHAAIETGNLELLGSILSLD